jgi:2-methylisocitrate lyase-like PEP mutase family enzyme
VKAAVAARPDPNLVIIARTDARAVLGLDEAVARMNAALDAGADIAFLEAPQNLDEINAVPKRVKGPCLLNLSLGGRTPLRDLNEAERAGYRIVIVPGLLLQEAMDAFAASLRALKTKRCLPDTTVAVRERLRRMGAPEWDALRDRFKS